MLEFRIYKNGNKIKSQGVKTPDGYNACALGEFFDILKTYPEHDFWFHDMSNDTDVTFERLLAVLKKAEIDSIKPIDTKLLNRVIRGGGFTNYIKQLEGQCLN